MNTPDTFTQLSERVWAYLQPNQGWCVSNAGVIAGSHTALIVDTLATERRTREFLSKVTEVIPPDVEITAVNTHAHGDHTFGNCLLPADCSIYGTAETVSEMKTVGLGLQQLWPQVDWGDIAVVTPNRIISEPTIVDLGGGVQVVLRPEPHSHTAGDVSVWYPDDRILFAGDLIMNQVTPFFLFGDVKKGSEVITALGRLDPTVLVAGHGPLGDPQTMISSNIQYCDWIQEQASRAAHAGVSIEELALWIEPSPLQGWSESERDIVNVYAEAVRNGVDGYGSQIDVDLAFDLMRQVLGHEPLTSA